jgi:predicted deacylase
MSLKVHTTARKLKVTIVIDAGPFMALAISDGAPARTEITIEVGGRTVTADIASKSLRKVLRTLADNGADKVVVIIQGVLTAGDRIEEAGLVAQVKAAEPQILPAA